MEFTILMNNVEKTLTVTKRISLRQHENLVDKLIFIVPYQYNEDIDLREFNVVLEWIDPTNVAHMDTLEPDEAVYKENYQRYFLPVTSPLNRYAGDIKAKLVFTKTDFETKKRYKLETSEVVIAIETIADYYAVLPDESFSKINDSIDRLEAQSKALIAAAEVYDKTKADNHVIDGGELYLTANGEKIGDGLNIATVSIPDVEDDIDDGIIDISGKYEDVIL